MVYIKINDKISFFLNKINQDVYTNPNLIEFQKLKDLVSNWNENHPLDNFFLHEMVKYDDIFYSSEYQLLCRDSEFNVNFCNSSANIK